MKRRKGHERRTDGVARRFRRSSRLVARQEPLEPDWYMLCLDAERRCVALQRSVNHMNTRIIEVELQAKTLYNLILELSEHGQMHYTPFCPVCHSIRDTINALMGDDDDSQIRHT